jgi:ribosomal protein S18 acetylase RimI-like enzyme
MTIRPGQSTDFESAVAVWRAANTARRAGRPVPPEHETRVRGHIQKPEAFVFVADDDGEIVGMGMGTQGLAADGAGPPLPGLCHVAMVFVAPNRWGEGVGRRILDALLSAARARGYDRAKLWTHVGNTRAQRLYEGNGFRPSGRRKDDELGEPIMHYEREL